MCNPNDRRCANCNFLKWKVKFNWRDYYCRHFGLISSPGMSVCELWAERSHDWKPGMTITDYRGVPNEAALQTGLPNKWFKELCAIPDFSAEVLAEPGNEGLRATNDALREWLDGQVKKAEEAEVQIL